MHKSVDQQLTIFISLTFVARDGFIYKKKPRLLGATLNLGHSMDKAEEFLNKMRNYLLPVYYVYYRSKIFTYLAVNPDKCIT